VITETKLELTSGWQIRAANPSLNALDNLAATEGWMPASVPGTVYQDLLAAGRIPDPHVGLNEQEVQWVADQDWCYGLDFNFDPAASSLRHHDLVFKGLDTFARVWLNGELILNSENMFVPARVPVGKLLRPGINRLAIYFDSALRRGREREALFGKRHLWNGDSSRLYVRKAQYHYGWDWGPVLLSAGPWKPIELHSYTVRIDEVDSPIWLDVGLEQARIELKTHLTGDLTAAGLQLEHTLYDPDGTLIGTTACPVAARTELSLSVTSPRIWWPSGHGNQPLYRVVTRVTNGDCIVASSERRLGLRSLRLVQESVAGEAGCSFYFEVNGKALFAGGANWIPDDTLLNRISPERYRRRVQQAVDANMIMLRVWAGGIYEDDAFFDACDEIGVLVWQDFLFACGLYPAHPDFLGSVQKEAEAAVKRLRHRPSLAIWCGNNEDYSIAESIGQYGNDKDMANFDARAIYEELLPRVCASLDSQRPYWPGSPYSPSITDILSASDPTVGDRHSWEVWHGNMQPYQEYHKVQGRFVSEFGMQSHPSLPLLESVVPEHERFPQSLTMAAHNKAGSAAFPDGHRRLAVYVADTLRCGDTLAEQVYATRFVQAEAMRYAYQDFRHRWQRPGARAVGGALVWQLNDCWPATSWAVIDSAGVVKPAWHAIRRALAPLAVALRMDGTQARGWVASDRSSDQALHLDFAAYSLSGETLHQSSKELLAIANGSTDFELNLPDFGQPVILQAAAYANGILVSSDTAWPEPFRFHHLAPGGLSVTSDHSSGTLSLRCKYPVKGMWLAAPKLEFSDNFLDLMPGQAVQVKVYGDISATISIGALNLREQHYARERRQPFSIA
jgi:beta-mannosidase